MGRKMLAFLRGSVSEGRVCLTCYKSAPAFDGKMNAPFQSMQVYRTTVPEFTFNIDYKEFFDGLSHQAGRLIFNGPAECSNDRKFTFYDSDVTIGSTYAYWVAPAEGEPIGPVPVKVRDPQVWWTQDRVGQQMAVIKKENPGEVQIETVGWTVKGVPIPAVKIGRGPACMALIGAVHAGESGAELMVPVLERLIQEEKDLLSQTAIAAIPNLDIDERDRLARGLPWYLRTNANGVDLNRNFPANWDMQELGYGLDTADPDSMTYRGPAPASEPETQAAMKWLKRQQPLVLYSFHCLAGICGMNFLGSRFGGANEDYVRRCHSFALPYVQGMSGMQDPKDFLSFECSAGSLASWVCQELKIPALDIEISQGEKEALQKCQADRTDLTLLEEYRHRHYRGLRNVLQMTARMAHSGS